MTMVTTNVVDGQYIISMDGHAAYGPPGQDIVCAGISSMCYMISDMAHAMAAHGVVQDAEVTAADGAFTASVRPVDEHGRMMACAWLHAARGAVGRLQAQYPGHVRLIGGDAHG